MLIDGLDRVASYLFATYTPAPYSFPRGRRTARRVQHRGVYCSGLGGEQVVFRPALPRIYNACCVLCGGAATRCVVSLSSITQALAGADICISTG